MRGVFLSFTLPFAVAFVVGCASQGSSAPPPPPPSPTITSVVVSPPSASLLVKATQQFTANVQGTGSFNSTVTWYVNDVQGGNSTAGTISANGLYTAPNSVPNPNSVTVKAQSVQDTAKSGTSLASINSENVQVSVSPTAASLELSGTQKFNVTVTGTVNQSYFWTINGQPMTAVTPWGAIDSTGLYTAPSLLPASPTVTLKAISIEDSTKSASAVATILAAAGGITVTITPQNPQVVFDGSQSIQFTATVTGTSNTAVNWSVDTYANGGTNPGNITSSGVFTPLAFDCSNVVPVAAIHAVSVANPGAQGVTTVNLVPPTPVITAISPQPADAGTILQMSGKFALGAGLTTLFPGPNGTAIPGVVTTTSANAVSGPVPLGASSGPLSIQQSCVAAETGVPYPIQESNSLSFQRLPRLRVRANRQVLTPGESTQMLAALLGDPTPQPITWSALFGTVTTNGVFTAGGGNWDKVTGCISGTQQCDFFVFSVIPARIEPSIAVVPTGGTIQLSEVQGNSTLSPTWSITAGGGSLSPSGLYTAATTLPDTGAIPITATATAGNAANAIGVVGGFPGMVNRIIDYPDISANASGATTLPRTITVDGHSVYVVSDNLPFIVANGHYKWIDAYDATDPAHPVWTGAAEGFDQDLDIHPMQTYASGGSLWRVTPPQINSPAGPLTTGVAFFDSSGGQPALKQFFSVPRLWAYTFYQGLLIGIPSSFAPTGLSLWSQVTALVFDGRSGILIPSQIPLANPNPSVPLSVEGIYNTDKRIFLLYQQRQSDGSNPFFISTYDLTTSPPALLQTITTQSGAFFQPGVSPRCLFGNLLFTGGGMYDISTGLPVLIAPQTGPPSDMNGSLALFGSPYELVDYSNPGSPKIEGLLYNGDDFFLGPARFVGSHAYVAGSGVEIFDVSTPSGGQIPGPALPGGGTFGIINDLLATASNLYAAENTDRGPFVTSYDLSQTPPMKLESFALSNEIPFSLVAAGHFLFVGTSTELLVLDASNPAAPSRVASLALPTSTLTLAGNVLYDGTTDDRLVAIDVTNPLTPVAGSAINLAGFPNIVHSSGNLLLVAADTAGLLTFSISNPMVPTLLSQFQPSAAIEDVSIDGNLALLAATDGGFAIADIGNPAAPVLVGQVPLAELACFSDLDPADGAPGLISISVNNGIAYLGTTNMFGRVFGFDYRQPTHPRLVSTAFYGDAILEFVSVFAFSGSNMFIAFGDVILDVDITQPRNFIRHMCFLPPFGSNAGAPFPELQKRLSGPSRWSPKAGLRKLNDSRGAKSPQGKS